MNWSKAIDDDKKDFYDSFITLATKIKATHDGPDAGQDVQMASGSAEKSAFEAHGGYDKVPEEHKVAVGGVQM